MGDLPVRIALLESGFGIGAGCGVGLGVGAPLNLGAIPVLGPALSGLSAGVDSVLVSFGGHSTAGLRTALRAAIPVSKIDAGLGCGVGLGYGFGVGLVVKPSVLDSIKLKAQEIMNQHLPQKSDAPKPSLPSTSPPPPASSSMPPSSSPDRLALSKAGVSSSLRNELGLGDTTQPSAATTPPSDVSRVRSNLGDAEPLDALLFRALLRQQEEVRLLSRKNLQLQQNVEVLAVALCDMTAGKKAKDRPPFCADVERRKEASTALAKQTQQGTVYPFHGASQIKASAHPSNSSSQQPPSRP